MFTQMDRKIEAYCKEQHISGVLRMTVRDQVLYRKAIGWADWEKQTPFSEKSMFSFYSLSKPFCAMGLLRLKDQNLVNLDAHPALYVPEAAKMDERLRIRHLLHHISGAADFEQNEAFCQRNAPGYASKAREHLKLISEYPFCFAPGTKGMYANINFVLCALIVENVSGLPYGEYMKREIFQPLGMKSAVVDDEKKEIPNRVQGYEWDGERMCPVKKSHDWMLGAGDLVGTVDDVYALNHAIKRQLILKPETWQEVFTPSPLNSMGMGCTVTIWHGQKRITHNGGHTGFRTLHIQLLETDFDLIFLSNSGFGNARQDLSEMAYEAFFGADGQRDAPIAMDTGYIAKGSR